jgi:hypothetical protein
LNTALSRPTQVSIRARRQRRSASSGGTATAKDSEATRLEVSYLAEGELVRHVSLRYPEGAPASVRQRVELAQGRYRVLVEGELRDGGTWTRERRLEAPAAGTVRLSCGPEPRITAGTDR